MRDLKDTFRLRQRLTDRFANGDVGFESFGDISAPRADAEKGSEADIEPCRVNVAEVP
jgi:hypothetical protein